MLKLDVICDGQYGSTGKGLLASWAQQDRSYDWHCTNAGAQSGHTSYLGDRKIVAYHLSTAGILQKLNDKGKGVQYLSAGCIIDPELLMKEIEEFEYCPLSLFIHPHAAVINDADREAEKHGGTAAIASTGKGVGSALCNKISRDPSAVASEHPDLQRYTKLSQTNPIKYLRHTYGNKAILEVPQGYSLGINSGFYPHTTSRECTVMQGLSDVRINPSRLRTVMMAIRAFPIRVGNTNIGNSGGWYDDQRETSWEALGYKPELTTVTGRVRRIATFSCEQYCDALIVNQPSIVLINFMNYLDDHDKLTFMDKVRRAEIKANTRPRHLYGFGPKITDIKNDWR